MKKEYILSLTVTKTYFQGSYVAKVFGGVRDRNAEDFVSAFMDDLKLSSVDFEKAHGALASVVHRGREARF